MSCGVDIMLWHVIMMLHDVPWLYIKKRKKVAWHGMERKHVIEIYVRTCYGMSKYGVTCHNMVWHVATNPTSRVSLFLFMVN